MHGLENVPALVWLAILGNAIWAYALWTLIDAFEVMRRGGRHTFVEHLSEGSHPAAGARPTRAPAAPPRQGIEIGLAPPASGPAALPACGAGQKSSGRGSHPGATQHER